MYDAFKFQTLMAERMKDLVGAAVTETASLVEKANEEFRIFGEFAGALAKAGSADAAGNIVTAYNAAAFKRASQTFAAGCEKAAKAQKDMRSDFEAALKA